MATADGLANAAQRRARMLDAIRDSILTRGYPPTAQELADGAGVHRSQAQKDLETLRDAGLIELDARALRGIRLVGYRVVLVPDEPAPAR